MNEFFQRLQQRKLVQWTLAYVAAAFALLQGIDIIAQQFGWPEGLRRGITLTGGGGQPLVIDSTSNPQAHELYLRGSTLLAARKAGLRAQKHNSSFGFYLWDRVFDPVRSDPRFQAVLAQQKLPYPSSAAPTS